MKEDFINKMVNECVEDWNFFGGELYYTNKDDVREHIYYSIKTYKGVNIEENDELNQIVEDNISLIYDMIDEEIESQKSYVAGIEAARDAYYSDLI